MKNCIFCQIVNGSDQSSVVYEDTLCLAFMDINPINKGHVLVIPKEHFITVDDCKEDILKHLICVVKKLNRAVQKATNSEGILNDIMNGEAAGQEIFHLHIHIVPRFKNDGFGWYFPKGYREKETDRKDLENMAKIIKDKIE